MKTKTISVRVTENNLKELAGLYSLMPGTSAAKAIKYFLYLRRNAYKKIKGIFTESEMTGIVASLNGTMLESSFITMQDNNIILLNHLEDSEKLESMSENYHFDYNKMIKKVAKLDHLQTFIIFDECRRFWNDEAAYGAPAPNLEAFLKDIC